jgi:hypothetical protein
MGFKFVTYLVNASINSAFFNDVYPVIPFSLAIAFNSATVFELKSTAAFSSTASFLGSLFLVTAFLVAFFLAPLAAILSI